MTASILIVDDEEPIRNMLSRHFSFLGYQVETASGGRRALQIIEERKMDIVISDIIMPEMDGVELLKKIRDEFPMTRVIMITGYITLDNALACLRHGADTCVFKPFEDMTELEEAVAKAIFFLQHWQEKLLKLKEMKTDRIEKSVVTR